MDKAAKNWECSLTLSAFPKSHELSGLFERSNQTIKPGKHTGRRLRRFSRHYSYRLLVRQEIAKLTQSESSISNPNSNRKGSPNQSKLLDSHTSTGSNEANGQRSYPPLTSKLRSFLLRLYFNSLATRRAQRLNLSCAACNAPTSTVHVLLEWSNFA